MIEARQSSRSWRVFQLMMMIDSTIVCGLVGRALWKRRSLTARPGGCRVVSPSGHRSGLCLCCLPPEVLLHTGQENLHSIRAKQSGVKNPLVAFERPLAHCKKIGASGTL